MTDQSPILQTESKTIRDDLYDSVVLLNHFTSLIKVSKLINQTSDDYFAEWIMNFMKVVNYTSHEANMESKAIEANKYLDSEPRKELYEKGLELAQDYIKNLFSQGIVSYRE